MKFAVDIERNMSHLWIQRINLTVEIRVSNDKKQKTNFYEQNQHVHRIYAIKVRRMGCIDMFWIQCSWLNANKQISFHTQIGRRCANKDLCTRITFSDTNMHSGKKQVKLRQFEEYTMEAHIRNWKRRIEWMALHSALWANCSFTRNLYLLSAMKNTFLVMHGRWKTLEIASSIHECILNGPADALGTALTEAFD